MHHAAAIVAVLFLGDLGQVMVVALVVKYDDADVAVNAWLAGARFVDVGFARHLVVMVVCDVSIEVRYCWFFSCC